MKLFVGLGNPGIRYENNRHNIGFHVIDALVDHYEAREISKSSFQGALFKSRELFFLKPATYMNLSGESLQAVARFYKIEVEDIVVIHDDLDLPFGAVRFKRGGGSGGHNGLKSIDALLGRAYLRVRMGIGKPDCRSRVTDYVLGDFTPDEMRDLERWIEHAAGACRRILEESLERVKSTQSLKSIESLSS